MKWVFYACIFVALFGIWLTNRAYSPPAANIGIATFGIGLVSSAVTGLLWWLL